MVVRALIVILLVGSALTAAQSPQPPADASVPAVLPVKRVTLYKAGVGYFEHLGSVRNRQEVTIRFTSAQLNDVLKSLTAIDLGKGQVTGISYNSVAPLEQQLGALRLPLDQGATTLQLLGSLRGARLEVTSGSSTTAGRLLSVEQRMRERSNERAPVDVLSIVTDAGEIRSFDLTPAVRVRVVERDMQQEIGRYLDLVGSAREQDVRTMVISTSGTGERPLLVSYVSEVPIWKSTYRLVLPAAGQPFLQGWAIVDNTIGEDWRSVELSLVAGAPQSFIQQISQPYYNRRPVVPMPSSVLLTPQTHQATLQIDAVAERGLLQAGPPPPPPASPTAAFRTRGDGRGGAPGGVVGGVVGGMPESPSEQMRDLQPMATGGDLGDLFEYRIKEPVTIRKNQSALVPIVNAAVGTEKVSLWNRAPGSGHPLRAIWITNGTGLTLDGGSITVIANDVFAGEGLIEPLGRGERRLVSYGADLGVMVDARMDGFPRRVARVRARDGIVIQETEERATWTYRARNQDQTTSALVIEHRVRPGWKLAEGQTPAETTADTHRFRLPIVAKTEATLVVREIRAGEARITLADVDDALVTLLGASGISAVALQRALRPVLDKKSEVATLERELQAVQGRQVAIVQDQERLRENMKALRGSAEEKQLLQRYTRQLDDQETRLETLRQEMAATTARRDKAREELAALIGGVSFDLVAEK